MKERGLIVGHQRDSTIEHVCSVAHAMGARCEVLDVEEYLAGGSIDGLGAGDPVVRVGDSRYALTEFVAIYQRAYAHPDAPAPSQGRLVALEVALRVTARPVVNRPFGGWQNASKPLQMLMLQRHGLITPTARATSIPRDCRAFVDGNTDTVYKSNSGLRSIVSRMSPDKQERTGLLTHCPTLFQKRVVGDDVRVHVFNGETFGVRIESDAVDYRYSSQTGSVARFEGETSLPPKVAAACLGFAAESGVVLAGFDFKVDLDGRWYCLEMNPAPAFETYDHVLGGVIARRLVEFLTEHSSPGTAAVSESCHE